MAMIVDLKNGLIQMTAVDDEITGDQFPSMFRLVGVTTAGHTAKLTDSDGKPLFKQLEAGAANVPDVIIRTKRGSVNGIKCTQISSGTVEIHLR